MNRRLTLLLGLCLLLLLTAFVQPLTPAAALERFFTEAEVQADWFAEDFLAQVPLAQIMAQLGAFQGIEGEESPFPVIFAQGNVTAEIVLNAAGQIAGGTSTAELAIVDGGANDSDAALAVAGELTDAVPFAWGGTIFMPGATPFGPSDLSSKPTLHFWAKGDARDYRVQLFCANLGQVPVEQPFAVTDEWQPFSFDLTTFGGCDTTGVQAIVISTGPTPGEFALG